MQIRQKKMKIKKRGTFAKKKTESVRIFYKEAQAGFSHIKPYFVSNFERKRFIFHFETQPGLLCPISFYIFKYI